MWKSSFSLTRVTVMALVLAGICAAVVLADPVRYHVRQWTEPVVVRPEISGVVYFYGAPVAGVQVRAARVNSKSWPNCSSLPVVAVSNKAGVFLAPAVRRPGFLVNKAERIPVEVCLARGKLELQSWVSFLLPNELPVHRLKCEYPVPEPWRPDNVPCYTP